VPEPLSFITPDMDALPVGDSLRVPSRGDSLVVTVGNFAEPLFAPLITNADDHEIEVIVNPGLRSAQGRSEEAHCGCLLGPSVEGSFIGYYRAFANSSVRIVGSDGRSVTFTDVARESSPRSGGIPLRITAR
jgi:hypothetical protein